MESFVPLSCCFVLKSFRLPFAFPWLFISRWISGWPTGESWWTRTQCRHPEILHLLMRTHPNRTEPNRNQTTNSKKHTVGRMLEIYMRRTFDQNRARRWDVFLFLSEDMKELQRSTSGKCNRGTKCFTCWFNQKPTLRVARPTAAQ